MLILDPPRIIFSDVRRPFSVSVDRPDPRTSALLSRRLGLRGEGRRVADAGLQERRARPPNLSQWVDHIARFRDLANAIAKVSTDTVALDGEVAVFDEKLVTRFHLLGDTDSGIVSTPPVFIAFDVLQLGSRALRSFPLADRRRTVEELLDDSLLRLALPAIACERGKAWEMVEERCYEGIVAKDPRSTYRQGAKRAWVKVKVRHEAVFAGRRDPRR
jgi:hypothetical protein